VGRERAVRRRPDLVLAQREVSRPRLQVRRGVSFAVSLFAVALRAVPEIELLARLALCLGADVGPLRTHRVHGRDAEQHHPGGHEGGRNQTGTH
jgi:hypothetical protein